VRKRILFLCTGNSARSQMAEWLVNHFLADRWEAHSAGTAPAGFVHPLAVRVVRELSVPITSLRSKPVEEFRAEKFDLVMTLCDEAAGACPAWHGGGPVVHLPFPDPAAASGTPTERLETFRRVRDAIQREVLGYLQPDALPESAQSSRAVSVQSRSG
jgi:arsenate reductase